jgi:hypothetical protein
MRFAKYLATAGTLLAVSAHSLAHDGHGFMGIHWHATDAAGLALVAVLAGLALWLSRGK